MWPLLSVKFDFSTSPVPHSQHCLGKRRRKPKTSLMLFAPIFISLANL